MEIENNQYIQDEKDYLHKAQSYISYSTDVDGDKRQISDALCITTDESDTEKENQSQISCQQQEPNYIIQDILHPSNSQLNIYHGLSITDDGVIRLYSHTNQICFGLIQQQAVQIQVIPQLDIINIKQCRDFTLRDHTVNEAINFIHTVPDINIEMANRCLLKTGKLLNSMRKYLMANNLTNNDLEDSKNDEFERFTSLFFQYLEKYNKMNPFQMYHYSIGRLNLKEQDMEYLHTGYSKSYLDFLGMDPASLSQIILRRKRVDLIRDKADITNITLQGLSFLYECHGDEQYETHITTFDGFPIKIKLTKRNHTHVFGIQKFIGQEYEYDFQITEIDVDLNDLQQLIEYRARISNTQCHISIDDFLRRELSYLFEDVEYTIQSLQFIDKFYSTNLNTLNQLVYFKKQNYSKVCGYRTIIPECS